MKLWLVRHARPMAAESLCYGRLEIEVDPAQTAELATTLARQLPAGADVRVSPRQRCEKLAQQLCKARPDLIARTDPDLAEMDFGTWEGQRWDALGAAALEAWVQDFGRYRPGGGESVNEVMRRVAQALQRTRTETSSAGHAVWLTHAGVIRAVHLLRQGVQTLHEARDWPSHTIGYGQIECFELDPPSPGQDQAPVKAS
ncbi:histidine phosphatase family protein [Curvibacter gracilis]|uniref:histidine phosphatase family protein n=1 Tax=Curvibacter gracilis TaxID=230310 RepID=UPI0004B2B8FE|nr:histidine phosphatase family protein [Curvibacter gracilis]